MDQWGAISTSKVEIEVTYTRQWRGEEEETRTDTIFLHPRDISDKRIFRNLRAGWRTTPIIKIIKIIRHEMQTHIKTERA